MTQEKVRKIFHFILDWVGNIQLGKGLSGGNVYSKHNLEGLEGLQDRVKLKLQTIELTNRTPF
jgi:hypothetical protein